MSVFGLGILGWTPHRSREAPLLRETVRLETPLLKRGVLLVPSNYFLEGRADPHQTRSCHSSGGLW